jgi:hypothetical protein
MADGVKKTAWQEAESFVFLASYEHENLSRGTEPARGCQGRKEKKFASPRLRPLVPKRTLVPRRFNVIS